MSKKVFLCYLRTHRRSWGLSQRDLAALMGYLSPTHVSRMEQRGRAPSVEAALACQVIFGIPLSEMFPGHHATLEERVMRNAYRMHQGLSQDTSQSAMRKRELLSLALRRATRKPKPLFEV